MFPRLFCDKQLAVRYLKGGKYLQCAVQTTEGDRVSLQNSRGLVLWKSCGFFTRSHMLNLFFVRGEREHWVLLVRRRGLQSVSWFKGLWKHSGHFAVLIGCRRFPK